MPALEAGRTRRSPLQTVSFSYFYERNLVSVIAEVNAGMADTRGFERRSALTPPYYFPGVFRRSSCQIGL